MKPEKSAAYEARIKKLTNQRDSAVRKLKKMKEARDLYFESWGRSVDAEGVLAGRIKDAIRILQGNRK